MVEFSFSLYDLEYFLLIFTRVSCFIFIVPFFSTQSTPSVVKVGISFFISMLLYQVLTPAEAVAYSSVPEYAMIVIKEAITGLLVGFGANMCVSIVNFAGSIADMQTGLSMVTLFDPTTKENTSITGAYYQYVLMLMLVASGMYRYLLRALADTFTLIPVNGAVFHGDLLVTAMLEFLTDYIVIGFRIVLPVFCVILLMNAVLGVLAKVSPQMNMFSVGIQLKIIAGLAVMLLTTGMLSGMSDLIFREMQKMMSSFVGAIQ